MKLYKTIIRILFVSVVLISVCSLSTQAQAFSITINLRGPEIEYIDESATIAVTKDGLTATLAANSGVLNRTKSGFGINAQGVGDDTDTIDNGSGFAEFVTIEFDQLVSFDQLALSSFTTSETAVLTIASGSSITLGGTFPSIDFYSFSTDNTVSIGQSIILAYSIGNGFSFDEFTVTLSESTVIPEPTTIILFGIGLVGLGGVFLRERYKRQTKQQN